MESETLKDDVAIVPYDPRWPELFRQEKEHLLAVLPKELAGEGEYQFGRRRYSSNPEALRLLAVDRTKLPERVRAAREAIHRRLTREGNPYLGRTHGD
jgi:hypothetical protein